MNRTTISWALGTLVALFGVATGVRTYWPIVGWVSPKVHAADVVDLRKSVAATAIAAVSLEQRLAGQISESADEVKRALKESQDEYRCDKIDAELRELRRRLRERPDDVDIQADMRRLEQRMGPNGLNCARFDT